MAQTLTTEFSGQTKDEANAKFTKWQEESAGRVRIIKKNEIVRVAPGLQPRSFGHRSIIAPIAYSMRVDYVLVAQPHRR
jgi:hypothetical protein